MVFTVLKAHSLTQFDGPRSNKLHAFCHSTQQPACTSYFFLLHAEHSLLKQGQSSVDGVYKAINLPNTMSRFTALPNLHSRALVVSLRCIISRHDKARLGLNNPMER